MALRAAVFSLSAKNLRAYRARVNPRTGGRVLITWTGRGVDTTQLPLVFSNDGPSLTLSLGKKQYLHCSLRVLAIGAIIFGPMSIPTLLSYGMSKEIFLIS